jgi:hypothetical protein
MNKAAEEGGFWLFLIKVDHTFDSLRGDQRLGVSEEIRSTEIGLVIYSDSLNQ